MSGSAMRSVEDNGPTLDMPADEMRRYGYRVIDSIVQHLTTLREKSVVNIASREETEALFREEAPEEGVGFEALIQELEEEVFTRVSHVDHPRMLAFIPGAGNFIGALGDTLASGFNIYAGTWLESAAVGQIELTVIDWFRSWLDMPNGAGGALVSGGSVANLIGLILAREARLGSGHELGVIYTSEMAHSSVDRAARILGFRSDQVRQVRLDLDLRIEMEALGAAIEADRRAGKIPFCVVANAGATSTGTIDPLPEIAELCAEQEMWLHVDAAYGGFATLDERGRRLLKGIERADSIALDPHKWLYAPFEAGCVLARDAAFLRETFRVMPDYLLDTVVGGPDHPNFCDYGIQLTRSARALKIWLPIKHFGLARFRAVIGRTMDLAIYAEAKLAHVPGIEITSPTSLSVFTFRLVPEGERGKRLPDEELIELINKELLKRIWDSGLAMLSSTRVRGRYVIRFCVVSHRTQRRDVDEVIQLIGELGSAVAARASD